jgi:hypothetical protein
MLTILDPKLVVMLAVSTLMLVVGILDIARRRRSDVDQGL